MKTFRIDMDMKYSHEFRVRAKNKVEAKKKAMIKMQKIAKKQSEFNIYADDVSSYLL